MRWYVERNGKGEGPFDESAIRVLIGKGEIDGTFRLCVQGEKDWRAIGLFPEFAA
jgi:hypothetical protein